MPMNPRLLRPLARRQAPAPAPTDPLFADVLLLMHFDGNTFTDSSSQSHSISVFGDAAISTAQSKFGGASGYFDNDGDYLHVNDFAAWRPGKDGEPFTIEFWLYRLAEETDVFVCKHGGTQAWNGTDGLHCEAFALSDNTAGFAFYSAEGALNIFSTGTVPLNQWVHLAVVYDGTTTQIFIDGQADATSTTAYADVTNAGKIQISGEVNDTFIVNGYVDELRITKAARYPIGQNFTPPSAAFPNA